MGGLNGWDAASIKREAEREVTRRLEASAIVVENRAKVLVSTAGTAPGAKGRRIYGASRSSPGEPPYKQTGRLRSSITHEVQPGGRVVRIGTNLKYGLYLEVGTARMSPRPWLRRALIESGPTIRRIHGA
jgi:phage gpG-like protein